MIKCSGSISAESARIGVLQLLCQGQFVILCDSNQAGAPVLVRPGTLLEGQTLVAYNLDGTPYEGTAATLGVCATGEGGAGGGGYALTKTTSTETLDATVLNATDEISVLDSKSVAMNFTGIAGGAILTFEASLEGAAGTWFTFSGTKADGTPTSTLSADGVVYFNVSSLNRIRARVSTIGTGIITYTVLKSTV